jgi:glucosylceramidase
MKQQIVSTKNAPWRKASLNTAKVGEELIIGDVIGKPLYGFGCCISELCVAEIRSLPAEKQTQIFDELFGEEGCGFRFCRLSVGANDFAKSWYSYNECEGDYAMEHFSIDRDRKYIIPAIKEAQQRSPHLRFFASPWSPPTWMKYPPVYNYGHLIQTEENLRAYALYFKKYVEAYAEEGIEIAQIHVQNEIHADQKFPSCVWNDGASLGNFMVNYLAPALEGKAEVWFGTVNGPEKQTATRHRQFLLQAMQVEGFRDIVGGAAYQWAGKFGITQAAEDFPDLPVFNSEMECGNGENTWEYAMYTYENMHHYFKYGARTCTYWNMALNAQSPTSTWGWYQNSLILVDGDDYRYTPEFYLVKHFAHFVKEGAVMLGTKGGFSSNATVFRNPDGSRVAILMNPFDFEKVITIEGEHYVLEPNSFNTVLL